MNTRDYPKDDRISPTMRQLLDELRRRKEHLRFGLLGWEVRSAGGVRLRFAHSHTIEALIRRKLVERRDDGDWYVVAEEATSDGAQ